MILEFHGISTEWKPMIKEVNGVSRVPKIGDLFEFDVSPYAQQFARGESVEIKGKERE